MEAFEQSGLPMPLLLMVLSFSSIGSGVSALIVEVEVDRLPRLFFKGPRWVSLNSSHASASITSLRKVVAHSSSSSKTSR